MEVGRRKRTTRNGVVAGSVWESRMISDEIKGGIKVFNGEEENSEESVPMSHGFQRSPETQTGFQRISQTHNKLQNVSKSAFVFGIGTFIIIASSYTKDINISFITVVSYLGLVYLAVIFLFRSIICRGVIGGDDTNQDYVVGEEEAFKALFCGDPATTMKLAIMLFVLAKCGSSITIWKMAKLGEL
ncbi:hypothetical protein CsSME_00025422 [Camellia sinensis var. sinensis]